MPARNYYLGKKNYSTIEKECLGIIWGIEKFRKYLYGVEFLLETDHKPLSYLQTAKVLNPRIMRWAMRLQPYRFRIFAIGKQDNLGADYLSRSGGTRHCTIVVYIVVFIP